MRLAPLLLLALGACGGRSGAPGALPSAAPVSDAAPGWARGGDTADDDGYRFICEGQAASEPDALAAAGGVCEDKICKLCGVEVESVVKTNETLTGVELQRQVVERCRRVRRKELAPSRKLVDCGPGGCFAWIQIDYSKEDQQAECKRLTDGNFADPDACQATIEAFRNTRGYTAQSFRDRVALIERAMGECSNIDVRPTPLMEALGEKLALGMQTFNGPDSDAPRHLKNYWLAPFPPLWQQVKESNDFVERLRLLRDYLAHKVLIMQVIETTWPDDDQIDTAAAIAGMIAAVTKVSPAPAYGTQHVQMMVLYRLDEAARRGHLTVDTGGLNETLRQIFPPETSFEWSELLSMTKLFRWDGLIDDAEWQYVQKMRDWARAGVELLEEENHGGGRRRFERFHAALQRSLATAKRPEDRIDRFRDVAPWTSSPVFILDLEPTLPTDLQQEYDWGLLWEVFYRGQEKLSVQEHRRFRERLVRALGSLPADAKERRSACIGLSDRFTKLEAYGTDTSPANGALCACLETLNTESMSLNNKVELYRRAMDRGLTCIAGLKTSSSS